MQNALSEGIHFIENLEPVKILTDKYNHTESLKLVDSKSGEIKCIKARSIFIAAEWIMAEFLLFQDQLTFQASYSS